MVSEDSRYKISDMVFVPQGAMIYDFLQDSIKNVTTNQIPFYGIIIEKWPQGDNFFVVSANGTKIIMKEEDFFKC